MEDLPLTPETLNRVLSRLSSREQELLKLRYGLGFDVAEVAEQMGLGSSQHVRQLQRKALANLTRLLLKESMDSHGAIDRLHDDDIARSRHIAVSEVIANIRTLTPELIQHLKTHHDQIDSIPPDVLEHLVAEFFAGWGWDEVRLVGRSSETSADILAGFYVPNLNSRIRYFVEIKRWRSRIGVEIIDQVIGAMVAERPRFGWSSAIIVATGGFKNIHKYKAEELSLIGIQLKDKNDLLRWLSDYRPSPNGLWVPREN